MSLNCSCYLGYKHSIFLNKSKAHASTACLVFQTVKDLQIYLGFAYFCGFILGFAPLLCLSGLDTFKTDSSIIPRLVCQVRSHCVQWHSFPMISYQQNTSLKTEPACLIAVSAFSFQVTSSYRLHH